jgi:hypothetical protein
MAEINVDTPISGSIITLGDEQMSNWKRGGPVELVENEIKLILPEAGEPSAIENLSNC